MRGAILLLWLGLLPALAVGQAVPEAADGRVAPDGVTEVQIDLPDALKLHNKAGTDGAGLCVFTSINHAAHWQNIPALQDLRDWMTKQRGGGWPERVDQVIDQRCKVLGVAKPAYVQVTSNNLDILAAAVGSGRMVCNTYSFSKDPKRYGGKRIAHMVNTVAARAGPAKLWGVLDNNYPEQIEWLTEAEYQRTYSGGQTGWAVIFLTPPPPPPPANRRAS